MVGELDCAVVLGGGKLIVFGSVEVALGEVAGELTASATLLLTESNLPLLVIDTEGTGTRVSPNIPIIAIVMNTANCFFT